MVVGTAFHYFHLDYLPFRTLDLIIHKENNNNWHQLNFPHIDPEYWNRRALKNSVYLNQTPQNAMPDQGIHWLSFLPYLLDISAGGKMNLFQS